jgi:protein transport protein DSL1/ZW10
LEVSQEYLQVLGDSWFEDCIVSASGCCQSRFSRDTAQDKQRQSIDRILAAAEGFIDTGEQDRYDECENAITHVLQEIRLLARQWKVRPK